MNSRLRHKGLRVASLVGAVTLVATAAPFSDSPNFSLDSRLQSFDPVYGDAPAFALDTALSLGAIRFADSDSFALSSTGINRVWGDSEPFTVNIGCGSDPNACNDGIPCTVDSCEPNVGCVHTPNGENCNDHNPCTDDSCDPLTGCDFLPNTNPCNDGNACTTNDTCSGGSCLGGSPPDCNDGNACTTDDCEDVSGCRHVDITYQCNDGNPCTNDTCDPLTGCRNETIESLCAPVADAGGPYYLSAALTSVTLDATASSDPNGATGTFADIAGVQWDLGNDGISDDAARTHAIETVSLADAATKGLTINAQLAVGLTVTDVDALIGADTTHIAYQNTPPTAVANGPYGPIAPGETLHLTGMVNDPDLPLGVGEQLHVDWDFAPRCYGCPPGVGFAHNAQADVSYESLLSVVTQHGTTIYLNATDLSGSIATSSTTVSVLAPDLIVSEINPPPVAFNGEQALVTWTVSNIGSAAAQPPWTDRVYLSTPTSADILVGTFTRNTPIAVGAAYTRNENILIPAGFSGEAYVVIVTDTGNNVLEATAENNNLKVAAASTLVIFQNPPDLQLTQVTSPPQGYRSTPLNISWTVTNAAPIGVADGTWFDRLYLSADDVLSPPPAGQDVLLADVPHSGALSPGSSYSATRSNLTAPEQPGSYWLIIATDASDAVREDAGESNNLSINPFTVLAPEYAATVHADIEAAVGPTLTAPVTINLTGQALAIPSMQPAANVPVTVRVRVQGARRVFQTVSGPDGAFSYEFEPLSNEAGLYTVFADHPAVMEDPAQPQDSFMLVGLRPEPASLTRNVFITSPTTGSVKLRNLGDTPITGISAIVDGNTSYLYAQAVVPTTLLPHAAEEMTFTLTATGLPNPPDAPTPITIRLFAMIGGASTEAASLSLNAYVVAQTPHLSSSHQSLSANMLVSGQTVVNFDIVNDGGGAATDVQVIVPCAPNPACTPGANCAVNPGNCPSGLWFNLATPSLIGNIPPGERRSVQLALQPTLGFALGNYTGQVIAQSNETSLSVPFTFRATSGQNGDLFIQVQDELTYYGQGGFSNGTGPLVAGASVRLFDAIDQSLVFEGFTDQTGTLSIHNKPTGYYNLEATAPSHGTSRLGVYVAPDQQTPIVVFLPSQAVTISWVVVPTDTPDQYTITIVSNFETNVPVPAITFDPPIIDLDVLPGEVRQIDLKIINHGLTNAEQAALLIQSPEGFTVTSLVQQLGTLAAGEERIIPITIEANATASGSFGNCNVVSGLLHSLNCDIVRWYWAPLYFRCQDQPGGGCGPNGCNDDGRGAWVGFIPGPDDEAPPPSGSPHGNQSANGISGPPSGSNNHSPNAPYNPPPPMNVQPPDVCAEPPLQLAEVPPAPSGEPDAKPDDDDPEDPKPEKEDCPPDPTAGLTDPVRLSTGEWHQRFEDLRIPGRGMDFIWSREYRSQIGPNSPQGNGWDTSYNVLIQRAGSYILLCNGTGRLDRYTLQPDNTWAHSEFFQSITRNPDGTYTLTFSNGGRWNFLPVDSTPTPAPISGRLESIVDRNGNKMTLHYDAGARLQTITDTLGRDINVAYNADGFIESVTDFAGRQVRYEYYQDGDEGGSFGDLKSVTTPTVVGTPGGNDFPDGKTMVYTYSKGFAAERLNHNLLTITDPKGQLYLRNIYHPTIDPGDRNFDRVMTQLWGNQGPTPELTDRVDLVYVPQVPSAANGQSVMKTIVNDRVGNVSEYDFDLRNRLIRKRQYTGRADPDLPTTLADNRPVGQLRPDDPPFYDTTYGYNSDSLRTVTTYPNGNITRNVYESDLDPNASRRTRGNLREIHRLPGNHMPVGDQPELVETFEYDTGMGSCCGSNFVTRHVDARGGETLHDYDDNGNRIRTQHRIPSIIEDFEYNGFGQLKAHTHPDNGSGYRRRDEFIYYADGSQKGYLKDEIVDSNGFALTRTYEYDLVGNVTRMTDPRGHDAVYVINELNQIVREISREVTAGGGLRYQKDFFYDANGNIVRIDIQNVDDLGVVQPNSHFTTVLEFDILNNLTRKCEETGSFVEAIPGSTNIPTCIGLPASEFVTTEFTYDANRNRTLTRLGEAVEGRQPTNLLRTHYDERNKPLRIIRAEGDSRQSSIQLDYDANGNPVAVREGLEDSPRVTVSTFDAYNRPVRSIDAMGNLTTLHYDANGNRTSERLDGELADVPGGDQNVRLSETVRAYDPIDRLFRTETAFFDPTTQAPIGDGLSVGETFYSDNSQIIRVVNDNNHTTLTAYDTANRRSLVTDAKGNTTRYGYDADSNVISRTQTDKSDLGGTDEAIATTFTYDGLDRLTSTIDNIDNTNTIAYDSRNNRVRMVDALGNLVTSTFDGLNRLTATTRILTDTGNGTGNPFGTIVTRQVWDDTSRLTQQIDDNNNATTYGYDPLNRQTSETCADGTSQSYSYDAHDSRTLSIDANGSVVVADYDALNRLVHKSVTPGPGVSSDTTFETFQYDGASRLVYAGDNDSLVTRSHDSLSHPTRETLNGQSTINTFDGAGNMLSCTYPGGRMVTTTYDELERKKTIADQASNIATYSYVGPDRVARREYGNGTRTDYQYDGIAGVPNLPGDFGVRRIVRTMHSRVSDSSIIDDRAFTWDRMQNKIQRRDMRMGGPQLSHDYGYDSLYRIIRSAKASPTLPVETIDYALDGGGNRSLVSGGPDAGAYTLESTLPEPADFQVNQYTTVPAGQRIYDGNGNLTIVDGGLPTQQIIAYDYRNRMVAFDDPASGITASYAYDPLGRRVQKVVTNGTTETTRYFLIGWQEIEEQDGAGTTQATYVFGNYIDEVLTMRRGGENYFYHADDLHNVMAVTDGGGNAVERYEYGDYGTPEIFDAGGTPLTASAITNALLFTGRRFDSEAAWYFFRTRYLNSEAGRFTTRDTIGTWGDEANIGNGLAYTSSNPFTFTDPYGNDTLAEDIRGGLAIVGRDIWNPAAQWVNELGRDPLGALHDTLEGIGQFESQVWDHARDGNWDCVFADLAPNLRDLLYNYGTLSREELIGLGLKLFVSAGPALAGGIGGLSRSLDNATGRAIGELNLTDARAQQHILDGHGPGRGTPGKSEFPSNWSDQRVLNEISDIARDPKQSWSRPDSRGYATTTKTVDGVDIKVVYDTLNSRVVTGYPNNLPRNP